jgi:hypothetical protein
MPRGYLSNHSKFLVARRGLALGAYVASLSAFGCVSVQGDVPEVVMTQHALTFEGSSVPTGVGETSQTVSFQHPYESFELPDGVKSELRPVRATVTATQGVADLAFLSGFTLAIGTRDPQGPAAVAVFECSRDPSETVGAQLTADTVNQPNVIDYWATGSTFYTLTVFGTLPSNAWAVDVDVTFTGTVRYEL